MDISKYDNSIQRLIIDMQDSRGKDPRMSISCGKKLLEIGMDRSEPELIGFARFSLGETYYLMNDIEDFYREMTLCMEPLEKIGEWGYLTMANNMLGIMSLNRGNAPLAMDYYMEALNYCYDYSLPDLEFLVHMNLAALYLDISDAQNAVFYYEKGRQYLKNHRDIDGYIESLTADCVGLGKSYLLMDDLDRSAEYDHILENDCIPNVHELEKLVIYTFRAGLYHKSGRNEECRDCINTIREHFMHDLPVMDIFDDIYDFLKLLMEMEEYDTFTYILDHMEQPIATTGIKNLQKKLLTLRMKYYKAMGMDEQYQKSSVEYFELSQVLERENDLMVSDTIALRTRYNDLTLFTNEVQRENEVLLKRSETDALTGMYNRQKLNSFGDAAFERARKNGTGFAVEILDIDYFKEYNDNYGHQAGDRCIRFVADTIMSLKQHPGVFCSRYGGDEFVLIYENYSDREVFGMARELKEKILKTAYEHKYSKVALGVVTISQGIFWGVPQKGHSLWNYLHSADNNLYKVKKKSRNSILLSHSSDAPDIDTAESSDMMIDE
ncbi:MAG: GGDEF domain-containing protein [Lachnospiraceae bacterium]|nr:GGDEF domain-containing protein [Lachnospiraceae bacterium]